MKRIKKALVIIIPAVIIITVVCWFSYVKTHTFILSEDEQIQPVTGKVIVSASEDKDVVFTDIQTGTDYSVHCTAADGTEMVKLERGKWYSVESGKGVTVKPVNLRIE